MSALRMGNNKETLVQGMQLLAGILDVLGKPDARKNLTQAIAMTEEELRTANEAKTYVESASKLKTEIAAKHEAAEQKIADSLKIIQEAKIATLNQKKQATELDARLGEITVTQAKKFDEIRAREEKHAVERQSLDDRTATLNAKEAKLKAKESQQADLETKLRTRASAAAQLMQGM